MKLGEMLLALSQAWWRMRRARRQRPQPFRSLEKERWQETWQTLGLASPPGLLHQLEKKWQEPQRAYHTLDHLESGLALLGEYRHLAARPPELELAFYFHDAVYDPTRADNEEQSAELAATALAQAGASRELIERIAALILFTRHQAEPPGDPDAQLLVDVDLAILGAETQIFDRYESAVREEYGFVPKAIFRRKRREILASFLARPQIYLTPALHERFEAKARENLTRVVAALAAGREKEI